MRAAAKSMSSGTFSATNSAVAKAHTILVVDDDTSALKATVRVLEKAGYPVLQAEDGRGALSQVRSRRPSLVLLDVFLPDIRGIEVLRRIRADPALEAVSVVLLSSFASAPGDQAEGLDGGADDYIIRPVASVELLARVRAHLRERERINGYRTSEAKVRSLIERQADAVLVVDRSGRIKYANPAAAVLFGHRVTELENASFGFPIVAGDDSDVQVLDIPRRDKLAAVTEMRVAPIDWEGQPAWIATLRDITARRTAELAVRESKALVDMATTVAHLGAWSIDFVTGARVWSDSTREILEAAPGVTLPVAETIALVVPEHRAIVGRSFDACIHHGRPFDVEVEATTIKGRRIYLRCLGEAVRDEAERIVRVQGAFQDITDLKLVEQRIAQSERRFRELTEAMPIIVWTAMPDGTVDYANRRFFEYAGLSPDEKPAQCWQATLPPEDLERARPVWAEALRTGEPFEVEFRFRRGSDQSFRWHLVRAVAIRDDTNAIVKWYGTAMDIHAARLLQEEASRLNERLTHARDLAEQANRAKSRFLTGMSHELRTPLNAVLGYAQLLHLEGGLNASQAARVQAMQDAGTHLLGMINCVLELSQIEAGRLELHVCAVDPRESARTCLDLVRPAAEAKQLALRLIEAPDVPRQVMADPTRLREVLLNLLGNAVKFTPSGAVELRLRSTTDRLRVEVADTGPGIAAKHRRQLFHDFERLDADITGTIEGVGLGLALSARLAALMGGTLDYEDNPGGGSVFWLELPLMAMANAPVATATLDPPPGPIRPLRLLVADDVATSRSIASAFAHAGGHDVVCVENGAEAVEAVATGDYDAVLMDVRMPCMDGLEATRRIRALKGTRGQIPIISMTTQVFAEQVEEYRRAGMSSHLGKPFTKDALLGAVARAVADSEARDRNNPAAFPASPALPDTIRAAGNRPGADGGGTLPDMRGLEGVRVLVAEDNATNRDIIREILERAGLAVEFAANGSEAVSIVAGGAGYDAVLMDLHMPVMDGYEATRRIRALPGGQSLPILAMTADAMIEDRENCLKAGMSGHIAKPIDVGRLFDVLREFTGGQPAAAGAPLPPEHERRCPRRLCATCDHHPPGTPIAEPAVPIDVVGTLRRLGGREAVFRKLLREFIAANADKGAEIAGALAAGDWTRVRHLTHALKGAAVNIGAVALSEAARHLEDAVKSQTRECFGPCLQHLDLCLLNLAAAAQALPQDEPAPAAEDVELAPSVCAARLRQLAGHLQTRNLKATTMLDAPFKAALGNVLAASEVAGLEKALDNLDFKTALAIIDKTATAFNAPETDFSSR